MFGLHKVLIHVRFLILTKVFIYPGCQMVASLAEIATITAITNKLIDDLGKMFTMDLLLKKHIVVSHL